MQQVILLATDMYIRWQLFPQTRCYYEEFSGRYVYLS